MTGSWLALRGRGFQHSDVLPALTLTRNPAMLSDALPALRRNPAKLSDVLPALTRNPAKLSDALRRAHALREAKKAEGRKTNCEREARASQCG